MGFQKLALRRQKSRKGPKQHTVTKRNAQEPVFPHRIPSTASFLLSISAFRFLWGCSCTQPFSSQTRSPLVVPNFCSLGTKMSFADSFWTQDYSLGFKTLFGELYQGAAENDDFIMLFTRRMDLEYAYGLQLEAIQATKASSTRLYNDDYVLLIKNAYQKINENFLRQGEYHVLVAANIRELVLDPFTMWAKDHRQRIEYLESVISDKHKTFRNGRAALDKLQKRYFNKCRMLEEFKAHYTEDELSAEMKDLEFAELVKETENGDDDDNDATYVLGTATYDHKTLRKLLTDMLKTIELTSHKVPILGTYHSVSTGSTVTQWILDNFPEFHNNIAKAEVFGQDLVNNGFLRLIGSMSGGKNFINSSQFFYQWKPVVFEITRLNELELNASNDPELASHISASGSKTSQFTDYFEDMKQAMGVSSIDYSDKTQLAKLLADVNSLDSQYFQATADLDRVRCEFEELVMDHLTFMQKCEFDRLKAVKKVTFDFLASFRNKISGMKQLCDELLVLEETISPTSDLKFLIENYATGKFKPHVVLYDNYYNSNIRQMFGVDLNVKLRLDRKVVPVIIQATLSHLDKVYPELVNDEERMNLWTQPVHLSSVHALRFQLNELLDPHTIQDIYAKTHPMIITNVLKLYFMELPDSVVPHNYYDLIKSLYQNYPAGTNDKSVDASRITGLQNVLVDLPKCSLATLDALFTHLNRLVLIIGSKNETLAHDFRNRLAKELGNLILRPKVDAYGSPEGSSASTLLNDKHQFSFVTDLFTHKDSIFKELRRRNSSRKPSVKAHKEKSPESLTPRASLAASSKSRLELKLKKAVHARDPKPESVAKDETLPALPAKKNEETEETTVPSTPPPLLPTKLTSLLKRSISPNKKKLSSLLDPERKTVVSSRPLKKDIIYDGSSSSSLPSGLTSDLTQPKFTPALGRKTSVKDLASQFDTPPETPSKDGRKNGSEMKERRQTGR